MSFENLVQHYRDKAQWPVENPTRQVRDMVSLLKKFGKENGRILDAGAGFGRNTVFLAEEGYHVSAVEVDSGAIPDLEDNIKHRGLEDSVEVVNKDIEAALQEIESDSLIAIVDSGMSHYLGDDKKKKFADEVWRILKQGGMITILHFSENEMPNPEMGRDKKFLQKLFPEDKFDIIRDWSEINWTHKDSGDVHHAWTVTLMKKE